MKIHIGSKWTREIFQVEERDRFYGTAWNTVTPESAPKMIAIQPGFELRAALLEEVAAALEMEETATEVLRDAVTAVL